MMKTPNDPIIIPRVKIPLCNDRVPVSIRLRVADISSILIIMEFGSGLTGGAEDTQV